MSNMALVGNGKAFFMYIVEPLKYVHHSFEPKQEWSYVDVREGAHMFYWLYYTTSPEGFQQAPLIMWLQVQEYIYIYCVG